MQLSFKQASQGQTLVPGGFRAKAVVHQETQPRRLASAGSCPEERNARAPLGSVFFLTCPSAQFHIAPKVASCWPRLL